MYKEIDEFCNEHFLLKEDNGYISIYKLDENEKEKHYQTTEIPIEYLALDDIQKIRKGIKIYTKK